MSLSLNFGNGDHFRLLLISISINFQKRFYCILWPWKPWYRAHPYDCSINILRGMVQFINFSNGGHFRLKKGFPRCWFWLNFFWRDLACQGSRWTPNLLFIENVRVHVNSYWPNGALEEAAALASSNGIRLNSNRPLWQVKAVLYLSSGATGICQ